MYGISNVKSTRLLREIFKLDADDLITRSAKKDCRHWITTSCLLPSVEDKFKKQRLSRQVKPLIKNDPMQENSKLSWVANFTLN